MKQKMVVVLLVSFIYWIASGVDSAGADKRWNTLRARASELLGVQLCENNYQLDVAALKKRFKLGASIDEIQTVLTRIRGAQKDCELGSGLALHENMVSMSFRVFLVERDEMIAYEFHFFFKADKLVDIAYSSYTGKAGNSTEEGGIASRS